MTFANRIKFAVVSLIGAVVDVLMGLLPARVRVMVSERASFVRPIEYPRIPVSIYVDSAVELRVRTQSALREPETVRWIETFFKDGDVFYDIGANVGAYSVIAAKLYAGRVKVCAFEPSALNFAQLVRNLALNHCGDTVIPLPIALAESTQAIVFNYRTVARGAALHALGAAVDDKGQPFEPALRQTVLAYGLDDLVAHHGLSLPSHIKIDVDGTEERILAGAVRTLASPSLRSVLMEVTGDETANVGLTTALRNAGLRLEARHPLAPGFANWLFVRDDQSTGKRS